MTRGAHHPATTPNGDIVRKDGGPDGRFRKRKNRKVPYYVRLNVGTFDYLESLLDVPWNYGFGGFVPGCTSRADIIEKAFEVFWRVNSVARELNIQDHDLLVTKMIEAVRVLEGNAVSQTSLTGEPTIALPAPSSTNP